MSTTRQRYVQLSQSEKHTEHLDDGAYDDPYDAEVKYRDRKNSPPLKSIFLAAVLTIVGIVLVVLGSMLITGYIETDHWDRGYPLLVLGALTLLPGSYVTAIAWCTFRGYKGYTYAMIPDYD